MRAGGHRWNPAGWTRRGLSPRGGVTVRHDQSCPTRGPKTSWTWRIIEAAPSWPPIIAKANPTPAGKLAFVISAWTGFWKHPPCNWQCINSAPIYVVWCCPRLSANVCHRGKGELCNESIRVTCQKYFFQSLKVIRWWPRICHGTTAVAITEKNWMQRKKQWRKDPQNVEGISVLSQVRPSVPKIFLASASITKA